MEQRTQRYAQVPTSMRRTRWWAPGGLALFATVSVALMLAPAAAGAVPATTLKAPFKTATVLLSNPSSHAGCGSATLVTLAYFSKTTGIGGFGDNAATSWCTNSTNNSGLGNGRIQVTLPIHFATNGSHNITAVWFTLAKGSVNLSAGTCSSGPSSMYSGCTRSARAYVYGFAYLIDKTLAKKMKPVAPWPGNFVYVSNYTGCYLGSCSSTASKTTSANFSGTFPWSWTWSGKSFNTSHKYVLQMVIFGGAQVVLSTYGGASLGTASANAQLNTGTKGFDEQLSSVTIS